MKVFIRIFICTFDPFGLGLSQYTFRERCDEKNSLLLGDGTAKYFFNCTYKGGEIPEAIRMLYDYILEKNKIIQILCYMRFRAQKKNLKRCGIITLI